MKTVYISSTFQDLKDFRWAVYHALTKMQYRVIGMEDYVAKDERTVRRCCSDASSCDFYVGIVGRRYGYVPPYGPENWGRASITELEYRSARRAERKCLLFLLDSDIEWPAEFIEDDEDKLEKLRLFRDEFSLNSAALFHTPGELAESAMASIHLAEAEITLGILPFGLSSTEGAANERMFGSRGFDGKARINVDLLNVMTSGDMDLSQAILSAVVDTRQAKVIWVDMGFGRSWWTTRLHLMASLLLDYSTCTHMVFSAEDDRFWGMSSLSNVKKTLVLHFPILDDLYRQSISSCEPRFNVSDTVKDIIATNRALLDTFGGEEALKEWISQHSLFTWFGFSRNSVMLSDRKSPRELLKEVLACPSEYVPLTRNGALANVIDRAALATEVAQSAI